ncbi:MAG: hypothetical protein ABW175_02305 [Bradyrhizobium sp.]
MTGYFSFGSENASREFRDEEAAIEFAKKVVMEIRFWDFPPGVMFRVRNSDDIIIFECRPQRALH